MSFSVNLSGNGVLCHRCGKEIPENNLGRQDTCAHCGADTRVCKNCKNYDRAYNNECREEQAPRVVEKEKGNFCEWFQPRAGAAAKSGAPSRDQLKDAAAALFGKKTGGETGSGSSGAEPSAADIARAAADALFKKKP